VIGLDHAAFILAAGFFLALVEGGMWGVPALIGGSLIGATLHLTGFVLPGSEVGVALSVILIGGLVMVEREVKLSLLAGGPRASPAFCTDTPTRIHIRRGGDAAGRIPRRFLCHSARHRRGGLLDPSASDRYPRGLGKAGLLGFGPWSERWA